MFDKLKMLGALASLSRNPDEVRAAAERVRARAAAARHTGEGGLGAARVTVNGRLELVEVELAPALVAGMAADEPTRARAGALIVEAANAALAKARADLQDSIAREARALGLPEPPAEFGELLR